MLDGLEVVVLWEQTVRRLAHVQGYLSLWLGRPTDNMRYLAKDQ